MTGVEIGQIILNHMESPSTTSSAKIMQLLQTAINQQYVKLIRLKVSASPHGPKVSWCQTTPSSPCPATYCRIVPWYNEPSDNSEKYILSRK
jgi:hypothetical protein